MVCWFVWFVGLLVRWFVGSFAFPFVCLADFNLNSFTLNSLSLTSTPEYKCTYRSLTTPSVGRPLSGVESSG